MLPTPHAFGGKVVNPVMEIFKSFLISVGAGVIANTIYYCVCKWLNGRKK